MLGRGVLKSQFAKLVEVGLAFTVSLLLTRWAGPSVFGSYTLILGWVSLMGLAVSLGFSEILNTRLPSILNERGKSLPLFFLLLLVRTVLIFAFGAIVKFSAPLLFSFLHHPELQKYVNYILVWFWLLQVNNLFMAFYMAQLRPEIILLSRLLQQAFLIGVVWLLSRGNSPSLSLILAAQCLATAASIVLYFVVGSADRNRKQKMDWLWARKELRVSLRFGLSVWAVSALTFFLSEQTDILLLGWFVADTRAVAYYKVGTALVWKLIGVITVGSQIVLASLSTLYNRSGIQGLHHGWSTFVKLSTLSVITSYTFISHYAPAIISLLYGPEYAQSASYLRIFVILTMLPFGFLGGGVSLMTLYALGKARTALLVRLLSGSLSLALSLILIHLYGALGAIFASGVSSCLSIFLETISLRRNIKLVYPWKFTLKIVASSLIGLLASTLFPNQSWFGLILSGLVYMGFVIGSAFYLKPLNTKDCIMIENISPRLVPVASLFAIGVL